MKTFIFSVTYFDSEYYNTETILINAKDSNEAEILFKEYMTNNEEYKTVEHRAGPYLINTKIKGIIFVNPPRFGY